MPTPNAVRGATATAVTAEVAATAEVTATAMGLATANGESAAAAKKVATAAAVISTEGNGKPVTAAERQTEQATGVDRATGRQGDEAS